MIELPECKPHSQLFARQPIFDVNIELIGYELLFRPIEELSRIDGEQATSKVLLNCFAETTLNVAVNNTCAFINFSDHWLLNTPPFGPENIVIEILEGVTITPKFLNVIRKLHEKGYQLALDDFVLNQNTAQLLPYASIVKVDILAQKTVEDLTLLVKTLRKHPIKLLAEKVETYEAFRICQKLEFDFYQGFYFCKPEIIEDQIVETHRTTTLNLLSKLQNPDIEISEVEDCLKSDPALVVKLLKLVNSVQFIQATPVDCLQKVIMTLGLDNLKRWVLLIVLTAMDDKPNALLKHALVRARSMENIAQQLPDANPHCYFFTGILSYLDAFFDAPLEKVIELLPIDKWMKEAILERSGTAGELLSLMDFIDRGQWQELTKKDLLVSDDDFNFAYVESIEWVNNVIDNLH